METDMEILKQTIKKNPKTTEDSFTIQFTYSTYGYLPEEL